MSKLIKSFEWFAVEKEAKLTNKSSDGDSIEKMRSTNLNVIFFFYLFPLSYFLVSLL